MPLLFGEGGSGHPPAAGDVGVGTALHEDAHDLVVAVLRGEHDRSKTIVVTSFDVGAGGRRGSIDLQSTTRDKRLVWIEPKGFRKGELKGAWKSILLMIAAAALVAVVVVCLSVWADLGVKAAVSTLLAAGAIAIMLVVMWGLSHLTRITVKITAKGIVWTLGETATRYKFGDIDHCEIKEPGPASEPGLLAGY